MGPYMQGTLDGETPAVMQRLMSRAASRSKSKGFAPIDVSLDCWKRVLKGMGKKQDEESLVFIQDFYFSFFISFFQTFFNFLFVLKLDNIFLCAFI